MIYFGGINWDIMHATQIIMVAVTALNVLLINKTCD